MPFQLYRENKRKQEKEALKESGETNPPPHTHDAHCGGNSDMRKLSEELSAPVLSSNDISCQTKSGFVLPPLHCSKPPVG